MNFLSLNEFAAKLNVTKKTATNKLQNDGYSFFKRGKNYKIPSATLEAKELFDIQKKQQTRAKVFMIGNHKGGSGKTTSSINIAASLAFYGYRVLLVDMDNQSNASTINKLHIKYNFDEKNITKLLLEMKGMDKAKLLQELKSTIVNVHSEYFKHENSKLDLLPNSLEWDQQKEMLFTYPNAENMLNRLLKPLHGEYDYIIIDTHPSMDITWRMSVMASDAIIIGLKAEQYSVEGLAGIFKRLYDLDDDYYENKSHHIEILGAIITDYKKNTSIARANAPIIEDSIREYSLYNHAVLLKPFISHSVKASEQQTLRGPIMFDDPISNMSLEYLTITIEIVKYLELLDMNRGKEE